MDEPDWPSARYIALFHRSVTRKQELQLDDIKDRLDAGELTPEQAFGMARAVRKGKTCDNS